LHFEIKQSEKASTGRGHFAANNEFSWVDPYAKPKERSVGVYRPKIRHVPHSIEPRTRRQRQAEKEAVASERRAIKKAARRHLKRQLLDELNQSE
jgi:hypothetical protein